MLQSQFTAAHYGFLCGHNVHDVYGFIQVGIAGEIHDMYTTLLIIIFTVAVHTANSAIIQNQLTDQFVSDVVNSAPLHDIGKITVPDAILNKPGRLDDQEYERMKGHAKAGGDIIAKTIGLVPQSGYLSEAKNMAEFHHEKWNGSGYPHGLKGTAIPLSARIMAVADVFDALVSKRSYKEPFTFEKAQEIIREGAGKHFDPRIVEAFFDAEDEVREIAEKFNMGDMPL